MLSLSVRNFRARPRYAHLALALFGLLLLTLFALSIAVFRELVDREERQTALTLSHLADVRSAAVSAWINERMSDAAAFSQGGMLGNTVVNWIEDGARPGPQREALLAQMHAIREAFRYLEVAIVDPSGHALLSTADGGASTSVSAAETVRQAYTGNKPAISTIHSRESGRQAGTVDIAAPLRDVRDPDAPPRSLLLLRADASNQLEPFVKSLPLVSARTEVVVAEIVDGQARGIASSRNAEQFAGPDAPPIMPASLLSRASDGALALDLPDADRIATVSPVANTPWYLLAMLDRDAARGNLEQVAWLVALSAGAALSLCGLALVLWTRERESLHRLQSFRNATEKALLQRHYDYLSRYANDMIILTDRNGFMLEVNDKTLDLLGRKRHDVLGQSIDILFLPQCGDVLYAALADLEATGAARFEVVQRDQRGVRLTFDGSARRLERDGQAIAQFIFRDISERRASEAALQESQQRLGGILATIRDVVWSFSPDLSRLNYINRSAEELLGYTAEDFDRNPRLWLDCIHPEDRPSYQHALAQVTPEHPLFDMENRIIARDGTVRWLHCRGRLETDGSGRPLRIDGVASDITERKEAERQVKALAYYDSVTRLPNRALLLDRLGQALPIAARTGRKVALLFMDLDNFKNINDSLGHQVGDQLLRAIARRLLQCVREEDTVARIGGDEFLIVLPDLDRPAQAVSVAEKILASTARPFDVSGHQIHTTISIGISTFPSDTSDASELVRHADSALYQAKAQGRNNFQFFTRELNDQILRTSEIERRLRQAIAAGALDLWYQPQVDTRTGRLTGAEALARWRHDDVELLSPAEFIPVAEERGLISKIGEWALREACMQCRRWQSEGLEPVRIAVNVSPIQFQQKNFAELVTGILNDTGLDGRFLELEITESALMRNAAQVAELTMRLRRIGVGISIDDFGTGYSSLNYLRHIPIDKIKIDRSFIVDMMQDGAITRAIVQLAHSLRVRVIAEGVESHAQIERLRAYGCDEMQGHYFSRAISADAFGALLADRSRFVPTRATVH